MTTHEILVAARNLIDRGGWIQVAFAKPEGYCASGAIIRCASITEHGRAMDAAKLALVEEMDPTPSERAAGPGATILRFNDAPERTKDEVLAAFDRAIASTAPAPADPFPKGVPEREVVA